MFNIMFYVKFVFVSFQIHFAKK